MRVIHRAIVFECPVLLHLRVADEIVKLVSKYDAVLTIHKSGAFANAASILDVLSLQVLPGDAMRLTAVGLDADRMLDAVRIMLLTYTVKGRSVEMGNSFHQPVTARAG